MQPEPVTIASASRRRRCAWASDSAEVKVLAPGGGIIDPRASRAVLTTTQGRPVPRPGAERGRSAGPRRRRALEPAGRGARRSCRWRHPPASSRATPRPRRTGVGGRASRPKRDAPAWPAARRRSIPPRGCGCRARASPERCGCGRPRPPRGQAAMASASAWASPARRCAPSGQDAPLRVEQGRSRPADWAPWLRRGARPCASASAKAAAMRAGGDLRSVPGQMRRVAPTSSAKHLGGVQGDRHRERPCAAGQASGGARRVGDDHLDLEQVEPVVVGHAHLQRPVGQDPNSTAPFRDSAA